MSSQHPINNVRAMPEVEVPPRSLRPTPVAEVEGGWCIEFIDSPVSRPAYLSGLRRNNTGLIPVWNTDHLQAIRISREEDAIKIADGLGGHRVAYHEWG